MKFIKIPLVVEAEQFIPFIDDMGKPQSNLPKVFVDVESRTGWYIWTLEGKFEVSPKDWIIKGIKGEFYPCKPDIFADSYNKVEERCLKCDTELIDGDCPACDVIQTHGSLDCCKNPECKACGGTGSILPVDVIEDQMKDQIKILDAGEESSYEIGIKIELKGNVYEGVVEKQD